ncbi:MAG: ABC transporter ATP-binding protein [Terrimicrobiaceae bacterium]|nr:ABC transporter ATP-binding protein [Terrimicrobiaceae bacterium]
MNSPRACANGPERNFQMVCVSQRHYSAARMSAMVELRRINKRFGDFTALSNVDFEIREGEFMTFLGPSGCGKTTCLRLISGFDLPTSGQVFIGGKDVTQDPPYRRDVNQVFQSYALFPHLTIYENIAFGLRMKGVTPAEVKRRVDHVVEMTSLGEFVQRRPAQMSGGQRQRVALARAIVCEPKVLLLDEPLSALDAKLRQQMRLELKQLQKRLGITFVFVTHDQEEALTMSDRIAVMNRGCVEQIGTVADIYYEPATRFVASFIGETNIVSARVLQRGEGFLLCETEGGLQVRVRPNPRVTDDEVLLSLRPEKIRVSRKQPAGENIFPARIAVEIFKGAVDELTLSCAGGLELGAILANDGEAEFDFHEGEQVFFRIQPADISIIAA